MRGRRWSTLWFRWLAPIDSALVACGGLVTCAALAACGFSSRAALASDADPSGGDMGSAAGDAGSVADDATPSPDAAPPVVTLAEAKSTTVTPGSSVVCYAPGAQSTRDGTWYRLFRPADFGVPGALHVTGASFASDHALNARGIQVEIGTYAGAVGGATLTSSSISVLATASIDVPDGEQPQQVAVLVTADVPAGAVLVVAVAAPSLQGVGHLNLGATTAGETQPGYFSSDACAKSPPQSTVMLGSTGQLVIQATGYAVSP